MSTNNSNKNVQMAHMINLLAVANIDGRESEEEFNLLGKIAVDLGLTLGEFEECMRLSAKSLEEGKLLYEVPESDEQKVAFLKNLTLMMMVDGKIDENEEAYVKLVAEKFGYDGDKALDILINNIYEDFKTKDDTSEETISEKASGDQSEDEMSDEEFKDQIKRCTALGKQALMEHNIPEAFDYLLVPAHMDVEAFRLFLMIINTFTRMYLLSDEQVAKLKGYAEKGYTLSQYAYGRYLYIVRPDNDSINQADKYFKAAQKEGFGDAIQAQSTIMLDGHYGLVDIQEAYQMTLDAIDKHSELGARAYLRRLVFGNDYMEADPQKAIDLTMKLVGENESEDISVVNPMFYEILGDAYEKLGDVERAKAYYMKAIKMGHHEAYGSYCCLFNVDDNEELHDKYLDLLDKADDYGDPSVHVYKAACIMDNYDNFEEDSREKVTDMIKDELEIAFDLGSQIAPYFLGSSYYYGSYGFEENNTDAWNWLIEGTKRDDGMSYSLLAQMIIDGNNPYEVSKEMASYCQLMALRDGEQDELGNVVKAYRKGELSVYAAEIERYYIPKYDAMVAEDDDDDDDEEEDNESIGSEGEYKLIAIVKTDRTADILEFDVEEGWDELPEMVGARRLDAIRTQPLYDISAKLGLNGHVTGWVDNMGLMKDLMMNPIGRALYPGPIAGDMILTMEDAKYNPRSFDDLDVLKKVLLALGAKLDKVILDDGPDDDGRFDAWS